MARSDSSPWRNSSTQVFVADLNDPLLDSSDQHHLDRVLRLKSGEVVCAADGRGSYRMCEYVSEGRLDPISEVAFVPFTKTALTVAFVPVKGGKPEWVVQKLAEMGMNRIKVTQSDRSVVRWNADRVDKNLARLQKTAEQACRQSRRLWIPEVTSCRFSDLADAPLADMDGRRPSLGDRELVVGPEGGWSTSELRGRDRVNLSDGVLRAETAAIMAAGTLSALRLGLLGPDLS